MPVRNAANRRWRQSDRSRRQSRSGQVRGSISVAVPMKSISSPQNNITGVICFRIFPKVDICSFCRRFLYGVNNSTFVGILFGFSIPTSTAKFLQLFAIYNTLSAFRKRFNPHYAVILRGFVQQNLYDIR